jgi:hypothetical protein
MLHGSEVVSKVQHIPGAEHLAPFFSRPHEVPVSYPLADHSLAQRLEMAEAAGCRGFVETRAALDPSAGASWRQVEGTLAMFDGIDSPITQTFNLGMEQPVEPVHLDEIEAWYRSLGSAVHHEVCPLADDSARRLLVERGYQPIEFTNVMFRPLIRDEVLQGTRSPQLVVRAVRREDAPRWIETSVAGWSEFAEYADLMRGLANVNTRRSDARCYAAVLGDQMVATGGLSFHNDVALLAGASTLPVARQQGAQLALLEYRLRDAATEGYSLAMMCARPGSGSQRNAERHGFRIAYTRVKWMLPRG